MNLTRARGLLSKINRVFEDYGDEGSQPSRLEVDLLREYLRRIYEALDDESSELLAHSAQRTDRAQVKEANQSQDNSRQAASPSMRSKRASASAPQTSTFVPEPVFRFEPQLAERQRPPQVPVAVPVAQTSSVAPAPRVLEVPANVEADVQRLEAEQRAMEAERFRQQQLAAELQAREEAELARARAEAEQRAASTAAQLSSNGVSPTLAVASTGSTITSLEPALKELFTIERATDLSDRLANAPVADLTKSMALNEKILSCKELFGDNQAVFQQTLQELNQLSGYDEAIRVLTPTARRFDWTEDERRPVARTFIKLVRRRYV